MTDAGAPDPRHNPCFVELVLNDLLEHRDEWRRLGRLYAPDCLAHDRSCVVRDAVFIGRRLGFVIEGDLNRGYRYLRWQRPRYVRIKGVSEGVDSLESRVADVMREGSS